MLFLSGPFYCTKTIRAAQLGLSVKIRSRLVLFSSSSSSSFLVRGYRDGKPQLSARETFLMARLFSPFFLSPIFLNFLFLRFCFDCFAVVSALSFIPLCRWPLISWWFSIETIASSSPGSSGAPLTQLVDVYYSEEYRNKSKKDTKASENFAFFSLVSLGVMCHSYN